MLKDYILLVDKPPFMSSHDCLMVIKKRLQLQKIGHTGTLDPIATGLMVVLVNEATKLSNFILVQDKTYIAKMQLFIRTDSGDISGKVVETQTAFKITEEQILRMINTFDGTVYQQKVPLYSAVKRNGKKMYEYARKNESVNLPVREVKIKKLQLLNFVDDIIEFEVTCSKGTYIRSLISDLAQNLKTIATLVSLRRTQQTCFDIKNAILLDDINETVIKQHALTIVDVLGSFLPIITVKEREMISNIKNGKQIKLKEYPISQYVLLVNRLHKPLAIYAHHKNRYYCSKRGFNFYEDN